MGKITPLQIQKKMNWEHIFYQKNITISINSIAKAFLYSNKYLRSGILSPYSVTVIKINIKTWYELKV